eukprot:1042120-Rhodomonas_salina.1
MESLLGHDARLGRRVHLHGSRQPFSAIAEAIAMSADEIVWFPLPVVLLALGLIDTIPGWDFYGDVCMMAACEQTLKFFCRRTRPHYAKQGTFYCLPGEWFSFPSGHTMRAAYFSLRLPHYLPSFSSSSWILTAWAVLVAWSRVVKGRHFPLDVLGGFGAGGRACPGPEMEACRHLHSLPVWLCVAVLSAVCGEPAMGQAAVIDFRNSLRSTGLGCQQLSVPVSLPKMQQHTADRHARCRGQVPAAETQQ